MIHVGRILPEPHAGMYPSENGSWEQGTGFLIKFGTVTRVE